MSRANSATRRTRVLIVDDHPMTRAGLVHVINHQPDMVVCGEAENAAKALAAGTGDEAANKAAIGASCRGCHPAHREGAAGAYMIK